MSVSIDTFNNFVVGLGTQEHISKENYYKMRGGGYNKVSDFTSQRR